MFDDDKRSREFLEELLLRLSVLEFKELKGLKTIIQENTDEVKKLIHLIRHRQTKNFLHLFFFFGDTIMAGSVTAQLSPTATVPATIVKTAPDGSVLTFDPNNIEYSVQDPTVVSFTKNADGSVTFKLLAVGTTQVGVADNSDGSSDTGTIIVTQGTTGGQNKLTMTFGTPTP